MFRNIFINDRDFKKNIAFGEISKPINLKRVKYAAEISLLSKKINSLQKLMKQFLEKRI